MSGPRSRAAGLLEAIAAWWTYAVVEHLFVSIAVWTGRLDGALPATSAPTAALRFGGYILAGALTGLACTLFLRDDSVNDVDDRRAGHREGWWSVATIVIVCIVAAVTGSLSAGESGLSHVTTWSTVLPILVAVALLGVAATMSQLNTARWIVPLAFVGLGWTLQSGLRGYSSASKLGSVIAFIVIIVATLVTVRRRTTPTDPGRTSSSVLAELLVASMIVIGVGAAVGPMPRHHAEDASVRRSAGRPNLILITLDTVRADHLSLYAHARTSTPNVNAFAATASTYRHAVAASDVTLTSHASIFTGLYPGQHGAHRTSDRPEGRPLSDQAVTLARILREYGYRTAGVVANRAFLTNAFGLDQGFDYYDDRPAIRRWADPSFVSIRQLISRAVTRGAALDFPSRDAGVVTMAALAAADQYRTSPLFLFVNYLDAHDYFPPAPFDEAYPGKDRDFSVAKLRRLQMDVIMGGREVSDRDRQHLLSQYDGAIDYIDSQLGILFNGLRARHLYDSSLVIVTSDHGEAFGERSLLGHDVSVYQDQVAIPLIVKYPGSTTREVVDDVVSHVDILPTALRVLVDRPAPMSPGRDLRVRSGRRLVFSESFWNPMFTPTRSQLDVDQRAVIDWPFKLIVSSNHEQELFNLRTDPREQNNLLQTEGEIAHTLTTAVTRFGDSRATGTFKGVDAETLERLRSLGYLR